MTKQQQCKGAADFLKVVWLNLYRPRCLNSSDQENCLLEVHHHFGEMIESYVSHSPLNTKALTKCFVKPVNQVLSEIAANYEAYLEEESPSPPQEYWDEMDKADRELDEVMEDWAEDHPYHWGYDDKYDYDDGEREYEESHSLHLARARELESRREELVRQGKKYGFDDKMREEIEWIDDWFEDKL